MKRAPLSNKCAKIVAALVAGTAYALFAMAGAARAATFDDFRQLLVATLVAQTFTPDQATCLTDEYLRHVDPALLRHLDAVARGEREMSADDLVQLQRISEARPLDRDAIAAACGLH